MATVQHANFIQYGRRRGNVKSAPSGQDQGEAPPTEHIPIGLHLKDGTDLRQIKVLPRHEWNRIQHSLYSKEQEKEARRQARLEKEDLHQKSKDVVKNWSNTIAGQRQKKLEARKIREEKEEEERVKIDIEEAKFQAEKRREAIEKAKTIQYFQTDRIKSFHGALLLTEVLKERDAQIELKKQKEASAVGQDKEILEHFKQQAQIAAAEEHKKAAERYQEIQKVSAYQKAQAAIKEKERQQEIEDDKKEGQELQRLAKLHEWEQAELEKVRREEKMDIMRAHKEHQLNKQAILALEAQKDEEDNDEIRLFATAKKRMLKLRKEKEAELFKEVQDHKDRMTTLLASQLKEKVDDEDNRIAKAVAAKEAKLEKEVAEKKKKLEESLKGIAAHRNEMLDRNKRQELAAKEAEFKLLDLRIQADEEFARKQEERRQLNLKSMKKLQGYHMNQINDRAEQERVQRTEDLNYDNQIVNLLRIEEDQFQQYANKVIDDAVKNDRNPYPLKKAAKSGAGGGRGPIYEGKGGIRPSYLTADGYGVELHNKQRSSTDNIKSKSDRGVAAVAKKRLGFVW